MGLFSRIKRKKTREMGTTYHCLNKQFTEGWKHDSDYNFLALSAKIPDCSSNSIDVKEHNQVICGICRKKSISYLQDNIIFTKQADNINTLIPNSGIYCLNCDLDICNDCMSYHLLLSSFRGPSRWLPDNKKIGSLVCSYDECIQKYGKIVPQKDWVKSYGLACSNCGVQYGVFYMPALSKILFDNPIYSHANFEPLYVTKLAWLQLNKCFGEDKESLAQRKEKIKKISIEVLRHAIDEASTVSNVLEQRRILEKWRPIFREGLDQIVSLSLLRALIEITDSTEINNSYWIKHSLEVANFAKNWCELVSEESKYKKDIAPHYEYFDKIQIKLKEACLKYNI